MPIHAKVTAYQGQLVFQLIADRSIDGEVATSLDRPGNIGQIIMDTASNLGISAEALALLKTIKRGRDSIGDVDWFEAADGKAAFGWLGGPNTIKTPDECEGSRQYGIFEHVVIPNEVPQGAAEYIDSLESAP